MFGKRSGDHPAKRLLGFLSGDHSTQEHEDEAPQQPDAEAGSIPAKPGKKPTVPAADTAGDTASDSLTAQPQSSAEPGDTKGTRGPDTVFDGETDETTESRAGTVAAGNTAHDAATAQGNSSEAVPAEDADAATTAQGSSTTPAEAAPAETDTAAGDASDDIADSAAEHTANTAEEGSAETTAEASAAAGEKAAEESPQDAFQAWLDTLSVGEEQDTMLRFAPSQINSINLSHVHSSGLNQFLAGRKTRLSTLLRDPEVFTDAKRAARLIRAKINELAEQRGISVGYVACGLVSWRTIAPDANGQLRSVHLNAPGLLAKVSITSRPEQDDYELQLLEKAFVNPALVRRVKQRENLVIDTEKVVRAAYATSRLNPHPAVDELRQQLSSLRSVVVENTLLVSTFADVSEAHDGAELNAEHPVIKALYQGQWDAGQAPTHQAQHTPLDERDPAEETLILDADASQQEVLDAVAAGEHVLVNAAPGTGATRTAANAAAALIAAEKNVLVVAERRSSLLGLRAELERVGLDSIVLDMTAAGEDATLRQQLIQAILRNERATAPELESIHRTLRRTRHQLIDHVNSLHTRRERWGCSPLEAMQALAQLTALDPAPATSVRLKRSVLDKTVNRDEVSNQLVRAAQLGAFDAAQQENYWSQAKLRNRKDAENALAHAKAAHELLPQLTERIHQITDHAHIQVGENFDSWEEQLTLLAEVRNVLDHFQPDIFERNVNDLIRATAPASWRKEHGVEISSGIRSRLRKVAKAYIRPGVQVDDLHGQLIQVERLRERWNQYALTQRNPAVPLGIAEVQSLYREVAEHLGELNQVLRPIDGKHLTALPEKQMATVLAALAGDEQTLFEVPELRLVTDQLVEVGLAELLEDLAQRHVSTDEVADELELAWWKSALEAMISGDDYLAMMGGDDLRRIEAEFQFADQAHIDAGARRLAHTLAQRWRSGLAEHISAATVLKQGLKEHTLDIRQLWDLNSQLVASLTPVMMASPLSLAAHVPSQQHFDAVIFLDSGQIALASALGAINRADQVIAFGDAHSSGPKAFSISVDPTATTRTVEEPTSLYQALAEILDAHALRVQYRKVSAPLMASVDEQVYQQNIQRLPAAADLMGDTSSQRIHVLNDLDVHLQASGAAAVETTHREVAAVVEEIFRHAQQRPQESLAVIAGNETHARAIAESVKRQLGEDRSRLAFFHSAGPEAFAVAPLERAEGISRDRVIFSLGYSANGAHFNTSAGFIANDDARAMVAQALLAGRKQLDLFSSLSPAMLQQLPLQGGLKLFAAALADPAVSANTSRLHPAPLLADLYERLAGVSLQVLRDYGQSIPAVIHYRPNPLTTEKLAEESGSAVAALTDGDESFAQLSVRERSRLLPQRLRGQGWRPLTLWTIEVFSDPAALAEKIHRICTDGLSNSHQTANAGSKAQTAAAVSSERQKPKNPKGSGRRARFQFTDGVLPTTAAEDQPHRWGDGDERRDQWLKDQRPPHWG